MAKDLLVVFGATGNQGGSVIRYVLNDPDLANRYSIRAITRDASSRKAQSLAIQGVEVVSADLDNVSSLPAALKNASFVFAVTNTAYQGKTREIETRQAKALSDEAVKQGAKYIIWSSMSHPYKISEGKLKNVEHFDVKAEVEEYIRGLPIKSSFYAPGSFMQNTTTNMVPRPSPENDGTYILANLCRPDTLLPLIDITETGAWISAILAEPDKYEGKFFAAAEGLYSNQEVTAIISKVTGKTVRFQQLPDEVFKGHLPEVTKEWLFDMYVLFRDYGYFGENMRADVEWARGQARGKLSTLEDFLRRIDYQLE